MNPWQEVRREMLGSVISLIFLRAKRSCKTTTFQVLLDEGMLSKSFFNRKTISTDTFSIAQNKLAG